jgi:signal transduction histidine kinase
VSLAVASYAVVAYARTVPAAVGGGVAAWLAAAVLLEVRPSPLRGWSPIDLRDLAGSAANLLSVAAVVWTAALIARIFRQQRATAADRRAAADRERAQLTRLAVAEERATIARELHDIVAHSLSVMILQANGGEYALDHDAARTRKALRVISATGADALEEIRQLVQILRGDGERGVGDEIGRVAAVVERARAAGLAVELIQDGTPPEMPGGVALAVYRIIQESLTNTLKHAGPAPSATVRVRSSPRAIDVEVTDTGTGGPPRTGGHGLIGMRERAQLYGGTFDAGPLLGGGWRVRARLPLAAQATRAAAA